MDIYSYYEEAMDEVFEKVPSMILEDYLGKDSKINSIDVIRLSVDLEKKWNNYKNFNVQFGIIIDENCTSKTSVSIFEHDFKKDIETIIQKSKYKSSIFIIDKNGGIIRKKDSGESISFEKMSIDSAKTNTVAFFLGVNGIDILIRGKVYKTQNHLNSYKDLIYSKFYSVAEYKKLLENFFLDEVQYDTKGRYFAQKKYYSKSVYTILDKFPKLLHSKPESDFQKDLEAYFKKNCKEDVLTEVHNKANDRYDIWVSTDDNELYVFEIKWLGCSITPEGNIFSKYDTSSRAIEGAFQLKEYVDCADKYSYIFAESKIYCGVLVIFDARENMGNIQYPNELKSYPQIDLTQHFKIEKKKTAASTITKVKKQDYEECDGKFNEKHLC